jgi:hypothetical protein
MKHPRANNGAGLPAVSSVPWSAEAEKWQRRIVWVDIAGVWGCLTLAMFAFSSFVMKPHLERMLFGSLVCLGFFLWFVIHLFRDREKYFAMQRNRPVGVGDLTQWMQHPWRGYEPDERLFRCPCGRPVEFSIATYFGETNRYAMVCECGMGHFQIPPPVLPQRKRIRL